MIQNGIKKPQTNLKLSKTAPKQLIKAENGPENIQNSPKLPVKNFPKQL
jgi:hypothetical protein